MPEPIPQDMQDFILRNFDSVAHLECLLLLRSDPEAEWSAQAACGRLYTDETVGTALLADLSTRGFLVTSEKDPEAYCYRPKAEFRALIDRLAHLYAQRLVEVTRLIHSNPQSRIQAFADAFRIRKKDD
jgi:hypothetical protein